MSDSDGKVSSAAFVRAEQPWSEATMAELYDAFPFSADLPLYLELAAEQGGRVLELCCGTGRVLVALARAGHAATGVDASEPMLAIARRKLDAAGPVVAERVRLVVGDVRELDLAASFDLALIPTNSFAHLQDRADQLRALDRAVAHLRPGGLLALDLFNPSPAWVARDEGSLWQDVFHHDPERGATVARTETVVSTDREAQVRTIRSAYEIVDRDGIVTRRFVEWPLRYTFRFEAEHLLERAGLRIEALHGGHAAEPFHAESRRMVFVARRP
jgi:SAM-dependent methyltransferase